MLDSLGLPALLPRLSARPADRFRLHTRGRSSTVDLPGGFAVSRGAFDAALVNAAKDAGATFVDDTAALLPRGADPSTGVAPPPADGVREVVLRRGHDSQRVTARVVLACTGLAGRLLDDEPGMAVRIARASYMGCAAIVPDAPPFYEPGIIHMAHGRGGYVGLVRLEDHRLDIAAALQPAFIRQSGGPGNAVAALLKSTDLPAIPAANDPAPVWHGTPLLTRRRSRVAGDRLFVLGDAAGYVEPFTGEGIAWAIASALAVTPIALAAIESWNDAHASQWSRTHRALLNDRQRRCKWLTRLLRPPGAAGLLNRVIAWVPAIAKPVVASINRPFQVGRLFQVVNAR